MKNHLIFLLAFLSLVVIGQNPLETKCSMQLAGPGNPPPSVGFCKSPLSTFIPKYNQLNDTINVNIILFKKSSGVGVYDSANIGQANWLISFMNNLLTNIKPSNIILNPTQYIQDSKIRLKLKNFAIITHDTLYYDSINVSNSLYKPFIDSNAINVFYKYHKDPGGRAFDYGANSVIMTKPNNWFWDGNTLLHEIGHCFKLVHSHESTSAPKYDPIVTDLDYAKEGLFQFKIRSCYSLPNDSSTNNLMGNNWGCREYLSPEQVAKIHFVLPTNQITKKFLNSNKNNYCQVNHNYDSIYNSNITINTARHYEGDIIIEPGNVLTINCNISMASGARIVVKQGAKLTINKYGSISTMCDNLWKGIEVWGFNGASQEIDTLSGIPLYQGMVEINGGIIKEAEVGVYVGKRLSDGSADPIAGGGIVICKDSTLFLNNLRHIEMKQYNYIAKTINNLAFTNATRFINTIFKYSLFTQLPIKSITLPSSGIFLDGVKSVNFYGCIFDNDNQNTPYNLIWIHGINSSVKMNDYCTQINNNNCVGNLVRNSFKGSSNYNLYLANYINYFPSIIDNVDFNTASKGSIYILNSRQDQITNCDIKVSVGNSSILRYGIYLDNCSGYKIENNTLYGVPSSAKIKNVGIYVNNSGPYANSIYNNSFNSVEQGMWAQNQNVNWFTQVGLKMNCNDFTNCKYDIGVQKGGKYAALTPNYTGVDGTQGITFGTDSDNVRNTYSAICTTNLENKFYINTLNTFFTNHGSFSGPLFHPTPQISNSCSNALELIDMVGSPPSGPKNSYCPSVFTPIFSNLMLNASASTQRQNIKAYSDSLAAHVDGGNTIEILEAINSGTVSDGNLKNMLVNVGPYLSDAVMLAYYDTEPPYGHDKIIHEINAPVTPIVYQKILSLNLPSGVMNDIQSNQNRNALSARRMLEAKLNMVRTQLELILNEKTRRFLGDTAINACDSIATQFNLNEIANSHTELVQLYISAKKYDDAQKQIYFLSDAATNPNPPLDFCALQQVILDMKTDPNIDPVQIIKANKSQLVEWANSSNNLVEGPAKALLNYINEPVEEETLYPEDGTVQRLSVNSNTETEDTTIQLNPSVKMYPNPASNLLYFEMENNNATLIEIRDVSGKLLKQATIEYRGVVDIESLQNGVYFVTLGNKSNVISAKKIAIIK